MSTANRGMHAPHQRFPEIGPREGEEDAAEPSGSIVSSNCLPVERVQSLDGD
jgi:hypothetical protein